MPTHPAHPSHSANWVYICHIYVPSCLCLLTHPTPLTMLTRYIYMSYLCTILFMPCCCPAFWCNTDGGEFRYIDSTPSQRGVFPVAREIMTCVFILSKESQER